jgi:hypothetical protein
MQLIQDLRLMTRTNTAFVTRSTAFLLLIRRQITLCKKKGISLEHHPWALTVVAGLG